MTFDDILELVDEFGTYQRLLLGLVLLPAFVPCGFHAYNQIFMAATPAHWCSPHPALRQSLEDSMEIPYVIGKETQHEWRGFRNCEMYSFDFLEGRLMNVSDIHFNNGNLYELMEASIANSSLKIVPCKYGWDFDASIYESTVVTEWNLVCEKSFYPTLALVVFGFSGVLGTLIFGYVQDTWGRRPAFFLYLIIQSIFGFGTGFAFNFWSWLLCRVGVGFTVPAITGTPFVLAMELVGPNKRTLCTILLNVAYTLCLMGLAGVAYTFRNWKTFAFATSLPFNLFFIYWWVLPESPRWLMAHGQLRRAEIILRKMARVNGKMLPPNFTKFLKNSHLAEEGREKDTPKETYGLRQLFQGRRLRRNTLLITFIWFINMGVYVGLSYYAPILGGNEFRNFFVAGLAELPTYIFLFPSLNYCGRRWTLFGSMLLGGLACVSTILTHADAWVTLSLYSVGKFGISAGFVAIQQIAAEIYPTVVRGLGISFSNVMGMIGPTLVPLVNYMGTEAMYIPLLILGSLMVLGGMVGLGLPETKDSPLPQTLLDAEDLGSVHPGPKGESIDEIKMTSFSLFRKERVCSPSLFKE